MEPRPALFRQVPDVPYNPDRLREIVRGLVTLVSGVCFLIVVVFYLWEASRTADSTWSQVKDAMEAVLPAVTSVLGTALGFYFGSQKR